MTKRLEDIYNSYDLEEFLMDIASEVREYADVDDDTLHALIQECHKHND
jgi:hypothetical protein